MEALWDKFEPLWIDLTKKFTMAFITGDRWKLYLKGMAATLELTACALIIGVVLGVLVAVVTAVCIARTADQLALWAFTLVPVVNLTLCFGYPAVLFAVGKARKRI